MITLNIAGEPEKVKKPWLWVYYLGPIDPSKDNIIRDLGTAEGRWTGSGIATDGCLRDNSFEFDHLYSAKKAGEQLKRMKLIDSFEVRI